MRLPAIPLTGVLLMKKSFRRLPIVRAGTAAVMIALLGTGLARAETVVATINGEPVTESELTIAISDLEQQFAQLPEEQRRAAALSAIIEIRLMAAAAEGAGLAEGEAFKQRMELLRQRALHSAYIEKEIADSVTDEAVRARYDEQVAALTPEDEVRARHIIVATEEEAKAIIAELDAGGNFEEIAKEKSTDGAAAQGGDLGYFTAGRMVPEFEQAAFALEVGAYSKVPIKTQFGWHVLKVEDKRKQQPPAFEQVAEQLKSVVLREAYFAKVEELRGAADVEITDPALKQALEPAAEEGEEAEDAE